MAAYFLDASALVKRYISEKGSEWISTTFSDPQHSLCISRFSLLEVTSAIVRRSRGGDIPLENIPILLGQLANDVGHRLDVIELEGVLSEAVAIAQRLALKASDCVQFASAQLLNQRRRHSLLPSLVLVSSDAGLNQAAVSQGLSAIDPANQ